ncbi:MAG: M16 family metallopeptidase [Bryobacteraceae bacterium]
MKPRCWLLLFMASLAVRAADVTIPIEKYKLQNGLRVILSKDNAVPVVAVYMIFNVGARAEEKGRTGFAHLFEHMMFEGSINAPKGIHSKYIKSNGGFENGSTHPDYTDYYETLPSNKLAIALWLESDRMRSLAINGENLTNQKEAVKQERRLSFDNRPYATAIVDKWPELAYQNWQSSHSLIGSFEDLNAASLEDVSKFFKTYYAPNNAVMVIAGDLEIAGAKKLVETYFGDIPSQPQPKHPDLSEPAKTQAKTELYKDPLAKVPGVVLGYPGPKRRSPDYYALGMTDVLLTGGESSRFQLDLVKGKQSVVQYEGDLGWPFASASDYKDPQDYALFLLYKPTFKAADIVSQVQEEIARIQKDGVDPKELDRARTFFRAQRIGSLQSALNRAQLLGKYEILDGDPSMINTEMDKFLAVTPDRIQAAARKYLVASQRDVLEIQPTPAKSEPAKESE